MTRLVAIGYGDESAAWLAERELERVAASWLRLDSTAVIARNGDGAFMVQTNHHVGTREPSWAMAWHPLFAELFFVPALGMEVGRGMAGPAGKVRLIGIQRDFEDGVRAMLQPGTSALFAVVCDAATDRLAETVGQFGGVMLISPLSAQAMDALQRELHGPA